MQELLSKRFIGVSKTLISVLTIFLACFTLVSRLTQNAFPAVEEWATYGHKSQVYSLFFQLFNVKSNDPRFVFSGGSLAFFPIGWIDWPISQLFFDPVLALRFSISFFLLVAGISVFILARHIGCSLNNAVFAAVCWLTTIFSISSWTSMPRLLAISLFCFLFISASTANKNLVKANLIALIVCCLGIAIPANPPALFAALLGLPAGFLFGILGSDSSSKSFACNLRNHLLLYLYPLVIFGPLLFIEWIKLRDARPDVQLEIFDFSFEILRKNAIGRGFWWEYAAEGTTRYTPFANAYDGTLVRLGMHFLAASSVVFSLMFAARQIFSWIKAKGDSDERIPNKYRQLALLGVISTLFLFLSSAHRNIPGFAYFSERISPLQMFREPFAKFNGIYLVIVILLFFSSIEIVIKFFSEKIFKNKNSYSKYANWVIGLTTCFLLFSVIHSNSFPYEGQSRGVINVDKVREIKRISKIIDADQNEARKLCISFLGAEDESISWEQANTERVLMAFTSKESDSWVIPGVVLQTSATQCDQNNLIVEIFPEGEIILND